MRDLTRIDRREALLLLAASAGVLKWGGSAAAAAVKGSTPFVTTDFAKLRRVLMCPPANASFAPSAWDDDAVPMPGIDLEVARAEHAELVRILRASGAEVLIVPELLQSAIERCRSRGAWDTWLKTTHPQLSANPKSVTAQTLLGADPATRYQTWPDGTYRHVIDDVDAFIFSRDTAVTTSKGVVLLNVGAAHRMREQVLLRFMFEFSPELERYPVVFDAQQEGLIAEGGDFLVVDEHTLFLGVGNRTDPRIAPVLARRLGMDVLAVQTRKADGLRRVEKRGRVRNVFMHLDTYFTLVGDKQALTLPWFLESSNAGKDPYTKFLNGIAFDGSISEEDLTGARDLIKDFGYLRLFRAGSGEEDMAVKDMKLVDYVRTLGYQVHFVGGDPPTSDSLRHLFSTVFYEHEHQGANIVATSPGHIVAYEGSPQTHAALRRKGITVTTFPARELWPWEGGPHCLTMPLERG
jgi:arginine deiminase